MNSAIIGMAVLMICLWMWNHHKSRIVCGYCGKWNDEHDDHCPWQNMHK